MSDTKLEVVNPYHRGLIGEVPMSDWASADQWLEGAATHRHRAGDLRRTSGRPYWSGFRA